jgi:hypothetical protein
MDRGQNVRQLDYWIPFQRAQPQSASSKPQGDGTIVISVGREEQQRV